MKIAVTSDGNTLDDEVTPRFGRCKYFVIVDSEDYSFNVIDNVQNLNASQGAGIQAGQTVINNGADAVLTGNCGPKAFRILSTAGMKICHGVSGTVREAVDAYKAGKLALADDANVEGHWV